MLEKPLNRAELDLLDILRQHHAKLGPVERNVLSVEVRGRGLEFGRALARLITLGLVEEITRRPYFLKRLFGAKTVVLLQPTAAGLAEGQPPAEAPAEAPAKTPAEPLAAPSSEPQPEPANLPAVTQDAPMAEPATSDTQTPADPPSATAAQTAQAKAKAAPKAPATAKPAKAKPSRPRPLPITAFTEDLGGTPLPFAAATLPPTVDLATLEGLRETLSVMGMDLTPAGEALAAARLAKGATAAEALSQIVLFAFGHAVQQDLYAHGAVADLGLRDYAAEVMREVEKLRDAGELADTPFERDMRQLWALLEDTPDRVTLVKNLLSDPVGGAAPPAVLPEELRRSEQE